MSGKPLGAEVHGFFIKQDYPKPQQSGKDQYFFASAIDQMPSCMLNGSQRVPDS